MFLRCDALGRVLLFGLGPTCDEAFLASSRVRLGESEAPFPRPWPRRADKAVSRAACSTPTAPATEERALLSRFRLWLGRADEASKRDRTTGVGRGSAALQALQAARPKWRGLSARRSRLSPEGVRYDPDSRRSALASSVRSLTNPLFENCGGLVLIEVDELLQFALRAIVPAREQGLEELVATVIGFDKEVLAGLRRRERRSSASAARLRSRPRARRAASSGRAARRTR